ncbi:MAG: chitobiase/beta-hexosaminidase C-terminal domain-containing protein [Terracidiphilus sp.]|nr:chitobiase/beta-hexosaminidase C-terminal domain-containing protein [Terracidiphilus sp.]
MTKVNLHLRPAGQARGLLALAMIAALGSAAPGAAAAAWQTFKGAGNEVPAAAGSGPIASGGSALTLSAGTCTGSALNGTQYVAYGGCTLSASGGTPPYAFSWSTSQSYAALVEGLVLNPSTGAITGTVYGQGGYVVDFVVTDGASNTADVALTFAIAGKNTPQGGCELFPSDSIFHTQVLGLPVDTSPAIDMSYYTGDTVWPGFGSTALPQPNGIPFLYIPYNQPLEPITTYQYQSYFTAGPWPWYATVEGTQNLSNATNYIGDGHSLLVQLPGGGNPCALWEMWTAQFTGTAYTNGPWSDGSNAYWQNLSSTGAGAYEMPPPDNGTSDAAGLPITPLLVTYQEVAAGLVAHPIRFTLPHTLARHVWPATAQAGYGSCTGGYEDGNGLLDQADPPTSCSSPSAPMGEIFRLKAGVANPSCASSSPQSAVIITALRDYGAILADNGGDRMFLIGTPDSGWDDNDLRCLEQLTFGDFEPVNVSGVIKVSNTTSYQAISATPAASTPTFSPAAGTYSSAQSVKISSATPDATIYYTTNGTTPGLGSTEYSAAIPVSASETIEAIAVAAGFSQSNMGIAVYKIVAPATLSAPAPGSTLKSASATFAWTGTGASGYSLWLGSTGAGSYNLHDSGELTGTSVTVGGLPTNGETIYARLYSTFGKVTVHSDSTYKAVTQASLTAPAAGSVLAGPKVTFTWSAASGASGYSLWLGSTGAGSINLYDSHETAGTSATANGLPTNGETIYARLYTIFNGNAVSSDSTYKAATQAQSAITSPTPGSTLTGSTVTFNWTPTSGASGYSLWLGSTGAGSNDLYNSHETVGTSATAKGLPTNGETIYARLYINFNGVAQHVDSFYTAAP